MANDYYQEFIDELAKEYKANEIGGFVELTAKGFHPEMPEKGELYFANNWNYGATLNEAFEAAVIAKLDIIFND